MEAVESTKLATIEVVESTKLETIEAVESTPRATFEVKGTPFEVNDIEAVEGKSMEAVEGTPIVNSEAVESDTPEVPKPKFKPVKNKRLEELSFPLYQESIALLEKHVYHAKKRGPVEFVEKRTINLRIKERHPSFNMVYKRVATWLRQVKQYKGEFYNGVKGYWLGTDGGLLAPLKPKATPASPSKPKRNRLASVPAPSALGSAQAPENLTPASPSKPKRNRLAPEALTPPETLATPTPLKPKRKRLAPPPEPEASTPALKPAPEPEALTPALKPARKRLVMPESTEVGVTGQLFQ